MTAYNFTDRVRYTVRLARERAAQLRSQFVGPEHILLGMIAEAGGVANDVLSNLNVPRDALREHLESIVESSEGSLRPDLPYTSHAKEAFEMAIGEAHTLNDSFVDTEHLLLGLLRLERTPVSQALASHGVTLEIARTEVRRLLGRRETNEDAV